MSIADIVASPQLYTFDARDKALQNEAPFADALIVEVDVTINEEYSFDFEVSDNPVEQGIDITDHKRRKPNMLRMSGIVTDSPNNVLDVLQGNLSGTLGAKRDDAGNETGGRSQEAYKRLVRIAARAEPIRVVTRLDVFNDMTFESFSVRKDDAGRYLGFSAVLREVRFARPAFGTFTPEVEHTATAATSARKAAAEPLDKKSIARKVAEAKDSLPNKVVGGIRDGVNFLLGGE